jgi:hypothetical protein
MCTRRGVPWAGVGTAFYHPAPTRRERGAAARLRVAAPRPRSSETPSYIMCDLANSSFTISQASCG